jgi:excisionase family DNA binding protein
MAMNADRSLASGQVPLDEIEKPLAEPLLDATAAAHLLGVRPSWIYEATRAGRLPHIKIGRHIRFLRTDLETWVLSRRIGGGVGPRRRSRA